ncbi:MAG TPA: hypothetical protein VFH26_08575 [Gemmatimonadales bacterium]|nr:hypothetical protein [Gemmatimonadales bacterium]
MRERVCAVSAAVGLLLAAAISPETVGAQVHGIPVYNSGIPTGIGVYADIGFPNTDANKGRALALTGRAGLGAFGATAILSTFNPEGPGDSELSVGATLNYKIFGGPLIPLSVTLQGGIGYSKPEGSFLPGVPGDTEVDEFRFPVGVGLALTIPNPALAIKPWIAPRLDIVRVESETESNFGIGAGVELNTLSGFGVHAAYDRVFLDGGDPGVFGVGAHYTFRVPGL